MAQKIKINGMEYSMKPGMKSMIVFEKINDKPFEIRTMTDLLAYIYSSIASALKDDEKMLDFNEMLDAFDEDPALLEEATRIVLKMNPLEKIVRMSNEGGPEPKKD